MLSRALLLDRDGVVNVDRHYVHRIDDFEFMPGLTDLLRRAIDLGYRVIIVTNQAGIARGRYSEAQYQTLTDWLLRTLERQGLGLTDILHCPYHVDGTPPWRRDSWWRKPNPGMLLEAAQRHRLDLSRSLLIGDMETDMQAGRAAGVGHCLLLRPEFTPHSAESVADQEIRQLMDAAPLLNGP